MGQGVGMKMDVLFLGRMSEEKGDVDGGWVGGTLVI